MYLLVVDDNQTLQYGLKQLLEEAGYRVDTALDLQKATGQITQRRYDLILLDWMLPDGSGVAWLQKLRREGETVPVLLFSSKHEVDDKVEALDSGADDYLEKPFSNIELLARIRALLRRESTLKSATISLPPVTIDTKERRVKVEGREVSLSAKEFDLLEFMAKNADIVLTRYQLLEHLSRDFETMASSNIVDAHIKNLRKKLGLPHFIQTVRGVGYTIRKG